MMRRRKKPDPNAAPAPVRDNGLPARPPELAVAQAELQKLFASVNFATGYGFSSADPDPKFGERVSTREARWRIYAFTDDAALELPKEHGGFLIERRAVPQIAANWGTRRRNAG